MPIHESKFSKEKLQKVTKHRFQKKSKTLAHLLNDGKLQTLKFRWNTIVLANELAHTSKEIIIEPK